MRYRNSLALFLVSVCLAGFYFLYLRPKAEERKQIEDFEKQFFRVDPKEIEFIRIETGEGAVDLVRTGNEWTIEKPKKYQPDMQAIQKMFDSLSKGRLIKVVGSAEERRNFSLDRPGIIVSLGYAGKTDILEIAGKSPTAKGYYAYNRRFGRVFLVNEEFVTDFNLNLYDMRDKTLFPVDRKEITRIRIRRDRDTIDIEKRDEVWTMRSPFQGRVSDDDLDRLLQTVAVQRAAGFVDWNADMSRLPQRISLELFGAGQRLLDSADSIYWGTEGDKGVLIHRAGSVEAARTSRDFFTLLDSDASFFRFRNLFDVTADAVTAIVITEDDKTYTIENKGGWKKNGVPVKEDKVLQLAGLLREMKAIKLLQEKRPLGKTRFVFEVRTGAGLSRLDVTDFNMDQEVSAAAALFVPVKPGEPKGRKKVDYWYALSPGLGGGVVVSSLDIEKIMGEVRALDGK